MKPSLLNHLQKMHKRTKEIDALLAEEGATRDINRYRSLSKEHSDLKDISSLYEQYMRIEEEICDAECMLSDEAMKSLAADEINRLKEEKSRIEKQICASLIPHDPNDHCNVYLEIRAGTGGNESALFSSDLLRMYCRFAERNNWKVEIVSESPSDIGGYKEVIAKICGSNVYSQLKFESGAHRVQRVPLTETQGRIHTSACTVAIMPEADEINDITIHPQDIRVNTYRASGAGGQHVNKTDSAVRITHIPTGIVVECQEDRSQHKNREHALSVLSSRILDRKIREQNEKIAKTRKLLVGTGDRSDRIRTYNFPQGRVTDHRINLTLYKIDAILDGDIFEITQSLQAEHQAEWMSNLGNDE
ncbi:peptide chain release factor 1 [Candidatus Ichthyocystis hellenicum]|uniref:peptide chain release factor 1 n=1 Tax=Candidatus Ichthyocystis hellenicum TaxID=1561003 RepID=UPI000A6991AF|nr:peptide chain release factor 1 [Candidatus Ichthyocystis hellenicum]